MNPNNIPKKFHWILPVWEELQQKANGSELSDINSQLLDQKMKDGMFADLTKWIETTDSFESGELMMVMIDLIETKAIEEQSQSRHQSNSEDAFYSANSGHRRIAIEETLKRCQVPIIDSAR